MINFLRRLFGTSTAASNEPAPYKIEPQVHSTDAVHNAVFVAPPAKQSKKSEKKPATKTGSPNRKSAAKKT